MSDRSRDARYGRRGGNWQSDRRQKSGDCEVHEHWWKLNDFAGCIHPEHGPYPAMPIAAAEPEPANA